MKCQWFFEEMFYITTDASDVAISGMISQGEIPNNKPINFFSRTLSDTQKRYSTTEKELLAIVESIKAFRRYFIVICDHKPLCHLFSMRGCGSRLFRQKLELIDYNFEEIHRPGALDNVADALSRINLDEAKTIQELVTENGAEHIFAMHKNVEKRKTKEKYDYGILEIRGIVMKENTYDAISMS